MASFYDSIPAEVWTLSNEDALSRYAEGGAVPGRSISGLSDSQLRSFPLAGTWSIQQIAVHLMDSDLVAAYRMKRIIAEDRPLLDVYDETAFSQRLHYDRINAASACEVFRLNREIMTAVLRSLPEEAFSRVARHPEVGELALGRLVRIYVHHLNHHLKFLHEKRRLLGA